MFLVVNGVRDPDLSIEANTMYRFRLVHAGVDGWLNLVLEDDEHVCKIWTVSRDGHYFHRPRELNTNMLVPPGSRVDFLMKCSRASTTPIKLISKKDSNMGILGPSMTWGCAIMSFQVTSSSHRSSHHEDPTSLVLPQPSDLRTTKEDVRRVRFTWTQSKGKDKAGYTFYGINGVAYPVSKRPVLNVKLGQIQEWTFESYNIPEAHPIHLHTNAFQVVNSHVPGCGKHQACAEVDYRIGDWRDTITVPYQGSVTFRFRPIDFTGKTLAHCHILAHEDEGMMLAFQIVR